MENDESSPSKPHYDISMSKRTRKPLNLFTETNKSPQKPITPERENPVIGLNKEEEEEEEKPPGAGANGHENDHKSLEELIKSRSSLGQHFTEEEKNLQVVVKQHEERLEGAQFKRLVSRYAKVLSRLVKIKQNGRLGSRKKPVLRLST